ncbi:MAG: hypothetical protein GX556_05290 [Fibrobacter sp.]|nr:hypothetical protein [Fibrobacter sp.]
MKMKKYLALTGIILLLSLIMGCAAKVVTFEQLMLFEADSLFRAGNYEYAKVKYSKIQGSRPESDEAKKAQYYLGLINIYYDNPFANWEMALQEFKKFASLYPNDFRIGEVNSWIRLLVVMQSFKKEYRGTADKLEQLAKSKEMEASQPQQPRRLNIDMITESLRNCYSDRDSLTRKSKELENFILDLERKCQQAGR